jgi:hypothetical protein
VRYGGIDAFNARMTEQKSGLSLSEVLEELDDTHRRIIDLIQSVPDDQLIRETRFRRRLRLDTYSHYPQHAAASPGVKRQARPSMATSSRKGRPAPSAFSRAGRSSPGVATRTASTPMPRARSTKPRSGATRSMFG